MNERIVKTQPTILPAVKENINPFPGLRPFGIDDSHLFFGRDGQSEEILQLLSDSRFVAVIGASGTGKSSLIYCGLLPLLYGGFIALAGSKWRTVIFRPGNNPVENLAQSISQCYQSLKQDGNPYSKDFFAAILRRNSFGIAEALKFLPNAGNENILLLIDQFEELFRYRMHSQPGDEPEAFVRLLIEAVNQSEIPVYMVLTMRSDFIGECSQYQELTTLINRSNYLIPQMTRDDFRSAITGPLNVNTTPVDSSLINQVLNDVGDNPDQLPILQHAMMRTWDYWVKNGNKEVSLGLDEYEAIGRLDRALSDHANEAYDELSERGKRICEILFKTITEKGVDNRGIRRPTPLADIADITKAPVEEIIVVIDTFRKAGRSFLTPSLDVPLTPESIIDVSHESLMRIWNRLKVWVEEEAMSVQMYLRLAEAGALYQEGKTSLWRPPDLLLAISWEIKFEPTLTWAKRYNPAFERAMVFLRTSQKDYEADERNKIRQQKRSLKRAKISAIVLGSAAILSLGFMIYAQLLRGEAEKNRLNAEKQSHIATEQKKLADNNAREAMSQKSEALKQKEVADQQSELARQQREIAMKNANEAMKQKEIADQNFQEATTQRVMSEKNAKEAMEQKTAAEKAREEAYKRRLLSIAQSMAIKALRVDDDKDLKALLVCQAYLFNRRYDGDAMSPDIYNGIHSALASMIGTGFNHFQGHSDAVNSIAFLNSNVFFTASSDGRVMKWNLQDTTRKGSSYFEHRFVNKSLAISPDKHWLACGSLGAGLIVFNLDKQIAAYTLTEYGTLIYALGFADSDNLMVAAENKLIKWNLTTNKKTLLGTVDGTILALSVSPGGGEVACGTITGKVLIFNTSLPDAPLVLSDDSKDQIYSLCYNHQGTKLAGGGVLGYLKIWDMQDKRLEANIHNHTARISSIQYSSDDKLFATSSYDQTVIIWNAVNVNAQPVKLREQESWVNSVAFSPTDSWLLTGALREPRLVSWNTSIPEMESQLISLIRRNLTQAEWVSYVGSDIPYEKTKP